GCQKKDRGGHHLPATPLQQPLSEQGGAQNQTEEEQRPGQCSHRSSPPSPSLGGDQSVGQRARGGKKARISPDKNREEVRPECRVRQRVGARPSKRCPRRARARFSRVSSPDRLSCAPGP